MFPNYDFLQGQLFGRSLNQPQPKRPRISGDFLDFGLTDTDRPLYKTLEKNQKFFPDDFLLSQISPYFIYYLKPYQKTGVQFILKHIFNKNGCILGDHMGLGKTLQVIATLDSIFSSSFLSSLKIQVSRPRVLIISPNTVINNWKNEINKWYNLISENGDIDSLNHIKANEVFRKFNVRLIDSKKHKSRERKEIVDSWKNNGGILILGYEMFKLLVHLFSDGSKDDIIILDEGHRLRNPKSKVVQMLKNIPSKLRIVLTGYPIQNHLQEYFTMVDFCVPQYLGSLKFFKAQYIQPIKDGSFKDSTQMSINKANATIKELTKHLSFILLRRDYEILENELPKKLEFVIFCKNKPFQSRLYKEFARTVTNSSENTPGGRQSLITCFQHSLGIVNHPDVVALKVKSISNKDNEQVERARFVELNKCFQLKEDQSFGIVLGEEQNTIFVERFTPNGIGKDIGFELGDQFYALDGELITSKLQLVNGLKQCRNAGVPINLKIRRLIKDSVSFNDIETPKLSSDGYDSDVIFESEKTKSHWDRAEDQTREFHPMLLWAEDFMENYKITYDKSLSGKTEILISLLSESVKLGDKMLIFTQSVQTMNVLENILVEFLEHSSDLDSDARFMRFDGSTSTNERFSLVKEFNSSSVKKCPVFLLSTRAASEGINLVSANRVVLFDCCWNPSYDNEAKCRVWRFGQKKEVFIYKLIGAKTLENSIYAQQNKKGELFGQVVDQKTTKRKVTAQELQYLFNIKSYREIQKKRKNNMKEIVEKDVQKKIQQDYVLRTVVKEKSDTIYRIDLPGKSKPKGIFSGKNFMVLRRNMSEEDCLRVIQDIERQEGTILLEVGQQPIDLVVSRWDQKRIQKWKVKQTMKNPVFNPQFVTPEYVFTAGEEEEEESVEQSISISHTREILEVF
eukprot:maker-scaffold_92-snap-gene-0.0-mRNA-1 protein AED:0.51 eAED:0.53 QI:0/0/0/0.33/1/1/3/0/909